MSYILSKGYVRRRKSYLKRCYVKRKKKRENVIPPFKCIKHYCTKSIVIFYVYFITMLMILFRCFSREHDEYDALFRPINRNSRKS